MITLILIFHNGRKCMCVPYFSDFTCLTFLAWWTIDNFIYPHLNQFKSFHQWSIVSTVTSWALNLAQGKKNQYTYRCTLVHTNYCITNHGYARCDYVHNARKGLYVMRIKTRIWQKTPQIMCPCLVLFHTESITMCLTTLSKICMWLPISSRLPTWPLPAVCRDTYSMKDWRAITLISVVVCQSLYNTLRIFLTFLSYNDMI